MFPAFKMWTIFNPLHSTWKRLVRQKYVMFSFHWLLEYSTNAISQDECVDLLYKFVILISHNSIGSITHCVTHTLWLTIEGNRSRCVDFTSIFKITVQLCFKGNCAKSGPHWIQQSNVRFLRMIDISSSLWRLNSGILLRSFWN